MIDPLLIDPELGSRVQFGGTLTVHIVFAALSVGLAPYIVYFTWKDVSTGEAKYERLRSFWTKIFAVGFVMGTATGIPMSFQFGTNFPAFSEAAGELIGGPLAFESTMAFFLEAVFLGVLLFGRERVSDRVYVLSSVLVMIGAWLSAFWILVVNSWMQTPQGYELIEENGVTGIVLTDPVAAYFTPRLFWMYVHMQNAAIISVTLLVAGVAAYFVWTNPNSEPWRGTLKLSVIVLAVTSIFQVIHGDMYTRHVVATQPMKFAAMEAIYETKEGAPLHLLAFPQSLEDITNPRAEELYTVSIPYLASLLAEADPAGIVYGLEEFDVQNPPVAYVFWSFRTMVMLGFWFIALGLWSLYRLRSGTLFERSLHLKALMASIPLGFVATITGWYVTEIGRQPWIVQDVQLTSEGVSQTLTSTQITISLTAFAVVYAVLVVVFLRVVKWIVDDELEHVRDDAPERLSRDRDQSDESTPAGSGEV
ncbi:cytochrome ubiquinol oxidase subunit I [Natronolimnohabitans sp. A-GB9]|uniref:cytochrome ubiquinol oxidase subunit I n=1 Tax=Natronolimnohabitans sp. A-GB9 TaxID=3069757 RepID=UPI0027B29C29|nr:cytochrome ubiquinol oxidase subunit I [Natronolimnohabitans sp. A-GB9]MDQ2048866.1 cytochrome ubiquinol oxidase subunit I [Natronolimnohabitans sp. A-GB9]